MWRSVTKLCVWNETIILQDKDAANLKEFLRIENSHWKLYPRKEYSWDINLATKKPH